jgi:uncharacterized phage protein gp47/JayE
MADMPAFQRDELDQLARNLLRTRRRGIDISYGSDWDLTARILGAVTWIALEQAKIARRLVSRANAFGDFLRQHADDAGVGRTIAQVGIDANRATGKVIILSTTASQTQPAGSILQHADGTRYTLDADVTTPATAAKVLRAGHRSGRRRLFQGHAGAGFVTALAGEVYQYSRTGEYVALSDVENGATLKRRLFDLYNDLDADPEIQDQFIQRFGAVGSITAALGGEAGNKDAKDVLSVMSPAGTVIAEAFILYTRGGADPMSAAQMQGALSDLGETRQGVGTAEDLRALALAFHGAELSECYHVPAVSGIGAYSMLPIMADGQYMGPNMRADFLAHMRAHSSIAFAVEATSVYESVDAEIAVLAVHVAPHYAPDWTLATGVPLSVSASTTTSLTLSAVDDISIGSRVLISEAGASGPYIVERRVSTLAGLVIGLDAPLPFPATPGSCLVTPGGPLGSAVIDAVYGSYEGRAPEFGSTSGPQQRYPLPAVPGGSLGLMAAVSAVQGVGDVAYELGGIPAGVDPGRVLVPAMSIIMTVERR